ncbi:unnamed protein product, partial [Brassica napus]
MFAAGEEPNGERVNTYHKPKRIESIIEALDPDEVDFLRSTTRDSDSESGCNEPQAEEGEEKDATESTTPQSPPISMFEDTTHSPQDLVWDDEAEDDTVDNMV